MNKIFIGTMLLLCVCTAFTTASKRELSDVIYLTKLVVVGTLETTPDYDYVKSQSDSLAKSFFHFETGRIAITQILKGTCGQDTIPVSWCTYVMTEHNDRQSAWPKQGNRKRFQNGDSGIWLVDKHDNSQWYNADFMPLSYYDRVINIISENALYE